MLLKARLYRMFALVFTVAGLVVFIVLYAKNVEGSELSALTNPFIILIVLVPFLPAIVLSWKARRMEKEYLEKFAKKP